MSAFNTKTIHAGVKPDPITGAVMTPISLSTTFIQSSPGVHSGYEYSRTGNPTRDAMEACIAELEKGEWAAAFASGSAATGSLIQLLNTGDEIVAFDDLYGGTYRYFTKICTKLGFKFTFTDLSNLEEVKKAIKPTTKMVWIETPTNPLLKMADVGAIAKIAHEANPDCIVVTDNTFATPYFQNPLELGSDLVMHSITKYLNGHSDVVMGVVAGRSQELKDRVKFVQNGLGAIPSPFDSFLVLRGLKTLHLRMQRHHENALAIAKYLEDHDMVEEVRYPYLPSHPQHELAKKQMSGFSGMITIFLKGGLEGSRKFLENVKLFALAESLGGVESLVEHPTIMTHASVPPEVRAEIGIKDNLVRLSVGCEDVNDLIEDLKNALAAIEA